MTFEEWWETALMPDSRMALAWEAWQEAARQERERCAKVARTEAKKCRGGNINTIAERTALHIAIAIRKATT